jgi:hypothetical protein
MASMNRCLEVLTDLRIKNHIDNHDFDLLVDFITMVWDIDRDTLANKYNRYAKKHNLIEDTASQVDVVTTPA